MLFFAALEVATGLIHCFFDIPGGGSWTGRKAWDKAGSNHKARLLSQVVPLKPLIDPFLLKTRLADRKHPGA
jgi:hypothetical protein